MRNRVIGVAAGLAIAITLLAWQLPTNAGRPVLLSEADGGIRTVALQYTRATGTSSAPCYIAVLEHLPEKVDVVVVCGDAADARDFSKTVRQNVRTPHEYDTVIVGKPITTWCKDRFLVDPGKPSRLLCPTTSSTGLAERLNDGLVGPAIAKALPSRFESATVALKFDAGDVLAAGSRVIVSDTLWEKNDRPERFPQRLRRLFGGDVVWLRGAPDHHIGMYSAPLDEKTVVVGDPVMGRSLWSAKAEKTLGKADFSARARAPFDRAARQFRAEGFRVVRAPLVVLGPQVYVTYTNGVFEKRRGRGIVYLPSYGLPELDEAGREAYESAGWEVRPVPVQTVFRYRGTIGCLINVLERSRT